MDPNQLPPPAPAPAPTPAPQAPQTNGQFNPGQYDFITDPQKAPKKKLLSSGSSKGQRIAIFAIGIILLFILLMLFFSFLTGSSKPNTDQLTKVMQQQVEIARVSQLGIQTASSDSAKSTAAKTQIVIDSQYTALSAAVKQRKIKISTKQLGAGKNSKTDQTLKTAQSNGRYDDAFVQQTRTSLEEYQKTLKTAYAGSKSKGIKDLLNQDYSDVGVLLEEINSMNQAQN